MSVSPAPGVARGHVQMRARERALLRSQPSVSQLDRPANQFETVERCADRRHGIGDQGNPVGALRHERGPDRNGIDMDPVDDQTGRRSAFPDSKSGAVNWRDGHADGQR